MGILLNKGGADAVHMPQIWRRRPTGFKYGLGHCLTQKLGSVLVIGSVVAFLHFSVQEKTDQLQTASNHLTAAGSRVGDLRESGAGARSFSFQAVARQPHPG